VLAEKPGFARQVSLGSLDINSGEFYEFNQDNTAYEDFAEAAMCSGSIPFVF
jgi:predicted acylesterase/phospholipase RssA